MNEITYGELFAEFCNHNPELGAMIIDYRSWGSNSIVVWLDDGNTYKVKRRAPNLFVMQPLTQEDINKKYGLNK